MEDAHESLFRKETSFIGRDRGIWKVRYFVSKSESHYQRSSIYLFSVLKMEDAHLITFSEKSRRHMARARHDEAWIFGIRKLKPDIQGRPFISFSIKRWRKLIYRIFGKKLQLYGEIEAYGRLDILYPKVNITT